MLQQQIVRAGNAATLRIVDFVLANPMAQNMFKVGVLEEGYLSA